jgi:hypothetical protein
MTRKSLIQLRRDTATNWASTNPILAEGEAGLETDTYRIKIGDGSTAWVSLPYQDQINYTEPGVEWNYGATSPACINVDLLGNTISPTAIDWSRHPYYSQIKRCNLADDSTYDDYEVTAWYGDSDFAYDGSNGQVMVWFPAGYKYEQELGGESKYRWYISATKKPGMILDPAFIYNETEMPGFFVGAFEACAYDVSGSAYNTTDAVGVDYTATSGDKLSSIAGAIPLSGANNVTNTMTNLRVLAHNRGAGWELWNYNQVRWLQTLYLCRYANYDSQSVLSEGVTNLAFGSGNQSLPTGYTAGVGTGSSDLGNASGEVTHITHPTTSEVTQQMSLFGVEAFYGNIWTWVDGINIKANNNPWIADHGFADDTFTAPYVNTGLTLAAVNGYVSAANLDPTKSFGWLASAVAGSDSTYLTDYYYQNSDNRAAKFGGDWADGANAGAFTWDLDSAASNVDRTIGARLAFLPHE